LSGLAWSHTIVEEPDGTLRLEITDEDGAVLPVARQVTRPQAEKLVQRISAEAETTNRPIKAVIRDPYFMAATVIMLKRLPD
jgi:hypothetical protein